jgi:hypothetical protein
MSGFIDKKEMLLSAFAGKLFSEDDGKVNPGVMTALKKYQYEDAILAITFGNFTSDYKVFKDVEDLIEHINKEEELDLDESIEAIPDNINGELLLVYPLDEALDLLQQKIEEVKSNVIQPTTIKL